MSIYLPAAAEKVTYLCTMYPTKNAFLVSVYSPMPTWGSISYTETEAMGSG
jgi:hypothetical protein